MTDCKYVLKEREVEEHRHPKTGEKVIRPGLVMCGRLTEAAGFKCTVSPLVCEGCDARVPRGSKEDGPPVERTKLRRFLLRFLEARLVVGEAPRYQTANPVDTLAAFRKYASLASPGKQAHLLRQMMSVQARLRPEQGGLPVSAIAEKVEAIAREHNLGKDLADVIAIER